MQQHDTWGWKQRNLCALAQKSLLGTESVKWLVMDGTQGVGGCARGDGFEKTSCNPTIKGLECSEEFGLIIRIYGLCAPTSHVLVS